MCLGSPQSHKQQRRICGYGCVYILGVGTRYLYGFDRDNPVPSGVETSPVAIYLRFVFSFNSVYLI